ncbi:diguanylate cyclase (GGDEF)-like protein/PAS domain S-box-containing protein [Paenibacillus mucilaginosus]|uniref:putative bifunctional diguanylate cyclase/phosphodiesterase n=1 Tax=Paenibacillus mucilaginosus TaxID=61624 RepID=UPI003D1D9E11
MSGIPKDYITASRRFCAEVGMDAKVIPAPAVVMTEEELEAKRKEYDEILSVVQFFGNKVLDSLKGTPLLLSVADEKGFILRMMGDETIRSMVNELGIRPGVQFTEEVMGTNVVSLSLKYSGQPIELIGPDHYHEYLHTSACYAVAFRYTDNNNLLGSLSIMTAIEFKNPLMITMLTTTIDSIERELLLRKQNRKLNIMNQIMLQNTRNGIIITDKEGVITDFNQFAQELTGLTIEETVDKPVLCLEPMGGFIHSVIEEGKQYEDIQIEFGSRDGSRHKNVCLFDAFPIYDEFRRIIGAFGQFRNITDRYEAEERYNYLANHDDLTDIPNRRYYKMKLHSMIEQAKMGLHPYQIAVIYLDLDRFKLVNDTLGHTNGDMLLKLVVDRLKSLLAPGDIIARMGGDEFMFMLPGIRLVSEVTRRVEDILKLFHLPFNMNGYEFHITASIGIAMYPDDGLDIEMLMIHADTAMYKAKERGKNQYLLYSSEMQTRSHEKIRMETSLRRALENNEFVLYYQPQIDIRSGKVKGVEALVRWQHPERGIVSPYEFIPLAEETGLIIPLDQWVLRSACHQNKKWQDMGLAPLRIAVNLSSQQFAKDSLVDIVQEILEESGLNAQYLELEITETMTMDVEHTIPTLEKLHALGVQISIDDFGTGYSSLNYLKKFSIDRLKIDQSFVRDIMFDAHDSDIVGTIIAMAHGMGLEVIAEGVEDAGQLQFLRNQNCNEVQGYYYSKPIPAEEFEAKYEHLQLLAKSNNG